MNFRPLNDRILVKRSSSETTTKSGIIIPENAKEKPMQGTIIEVGVGSVMFGSEWEGQTSVVNGDGTTRTSSSSAT